MRILLLLAVSLIALAGCGGGSDATTTRSQTRPNQQPQSQTAYVALADTICKNHQSRREDLESQARDLGPIASRIQAHRIAVLLRQESRNRLAEVRELEKIPAPVRNSAEAASVLASLRAEARLIGEWAGAYDALDPAAIRRLQIRLGAITAMAADAARAYGFEVCGRQ